LGESTRLTVAQYPCNHWYVAEHEPKDIQFYDRPAFGYQVILFVQQGISRSLEEGKYLGIHPTLYTVLEYQYGSPYSYPARDEAQARQMAVTYCMTAAADHWSPSRPGWMPESTPSAASFQRCAW
jgi:hypothetical protein